MPSLGVRLPDNLFNAWRERCRSERVTASGALRSIIERELIEPPILRVKQAEKPAKKQRVAVWLTDSEIAGISARLTLQGGTRAGWIVKAIRGALSQDPQLSDSESELLRESNYQLLAIGRNLNQIARRLNERQSRQEVTIEQIESLVKQIKSHTRAVDKLLAANTERWPLT